MSEYSKAYYQKNKEKCKEYGKKYKIENKEKWNKSQREYYWKNVERLRPIAAARQRRYNHIKNPRILSDNPTAIHLREYRKKFKEEYGVSWNQIYRYGKNALIAVKKTNRKCSRCGSDKNLAIHHKDGNGKYSKNPNNTLNNLMVLCRSCHIILHRESNRRAGEII